jgi:hypothetical protein
VAQPNITPIDTPAIKPHQIITRAIASSIFEPRQLTHTANEPALGQIITHRDQQSAEHEFRHVVEKIRVDEQRRQRHPRNNQAGDTAVLAKLEVKVCSPARDAGNVAADRRAAQVDDTLHFEFSIENCLALGRDLDSTGEEIQSAVANGEADLGIGFDFTKDSNLKVLARAVGKLGAVMAPNHPLAKRANIRLSDCMDYPLVVADTSSAIRPYLDAAFTRVSLDPQPIIETNAIEIMRHAAILENGITFLTPFDIEFERRAGRLVYVAVRELSQENQALMLIGHERGSSAIASVLAEMLKTMMQQAAS